MLSEYLGGNMVSGGKQKALHGGFNNAFATNESGVSLLAGGFRSAADGSFNAIDLEGYTYNPITETYYKVGVVNTVLFIGAISKIYGFSVRLFSNTPHIETDTYTSGLFTTDIASGTAVKSIRIPFNSPVKTIKIKSTTSLTNIEAKLFDYAGNELETLITGKACNATTKSFNVTVDQTMSYTDSYVRVTCAGNSEVGMEIEVII